MTKYILKTIKNTIFVPTTVKKQKKTFNEKIGAFSVIIDDIDAANEIIQRALNFGLSTKKLNSIIPDKNRSSLAFFFEGDYDFEYVDTAFESIVRNLVPELSAKNKKYTIINKLREASEKKRNLRKELGVRGKTLRQLVVLEKEFKNALKHKYVNVLTTPIKKEKCYSCEDTYISVSDHYVQIGSQFIAKNPNDLIVMR